MSVKDEKRFVDVKKLTALFKRWDFVEPVVSQTLLTGCFVYPPQETIWEGQRDSV